MTPINSRDPIPSSCNGVRQLVVTTPAHRRATIFLWFKTPNNRDRKTPMIRTIVYGAPIVIAGIAGGLIAVAPVTTTALADGPTSTAAWQKNGPVSADTGAPFGDAINGTDPLVPFGTDPQVPVTLGYVNRNHDEGITTNGEV